MCGDRTLLLCVDALLTVRYFRSRLISDTGQKQQQQQPEKQLKNKKNKNWTADTAQYSTAVETKRSGSENQTVQKLTWFLRMKYVRSKESVYFCHNSIVRYFAYCCFGSTERFKEIVMCARAIFSASASGFTSNGIIQLLWPRWPRRINWWFEKLRGWGKGETFSIRRRETNRERPMTNEEEWSARREEEEAQGLNAPHKWINFY